MTSVGPLVCAVSAHRTAKAALVRRIEAAHRANEDRQDAPRGHYTAARQSAPARPAQPLSALAAQIIGALDVTAPAAAGYDAYVKASRLLQLESHRVDVSGL